MSNTAELLNLALTILSGRVMVAAPMVLAFALFCWALALGSILPLITASLFAVLVFLPLLFTFGRSPRA